MLLQPYNSYLIIATIKEAESHEDRIHWILMKKSEAINKHKHNDGKLKTSLSICSFKQNIFIYGILMNHKSILYTNGGMQKWGVNYRKTYPPVANWISMISLLSLASMHE